MVYGSEPDWNTLIAARLDSDGEALDSISEEMRRWDDPEFDSDYAPGNTPFHRHDLAPTINEALNWTAAAIGGALSTHAANALLKLVGIG